MPLAVVIITRSGETLRFPNWSRDEAVAVSRMQHQLTDRAAWHDNIKQVHLELDGVRTSAVRLPRPPDYW